MQIVSQKFLLIYSSTVSTALAVVILMSAGAHKGQTFDEIDVHRINVVEPDGTLRMVISNKDVYKRQLPMMLPYLVASFRSQLAALASDEGSAVAGPTPLPTPTLPSAR